MAERLLVAAALAAVVLALAWWWRRRDGRFTEAHGRFDRSDLGLPGRARPSALIVEFFGEHCAPCRVVHQRLERIAAEVPDVAVARVDAGARADLADRYDVRRVPTVFVTDPSLRIVWRASGVPSEESIKTVLLGPDWAGRPHPDGAADATLPRRRA